MLQPEKRRILKVDQFAFGFDPNFLREIIHSHPLFRELTEEDISLITNKSLLMEKEKDSTLVSKDDYAEGIYLLVDGVLRKEFTHENSHILFLGSTIGVHLILNPTSRFDVSIRCESKCRVLLIRSELITRFMNKYPNFERVICLLAFQHFLQSVNHRKKLHEVISLD